MSGMNLPQLLKRETLVAPHTSGVHPLDKTIAGQVTRSSQLRVQRQHFAVGAWLSVLALITWVWWASLPVVNVRNMGELGLLLVLPISVYIAYVGLTISFCLAVRFQPPHPILLLHLILLILMIHGTPHLLYGTIRYSWAWKHVGIIDYIQQYGSVNPATMVLSAYHNWPGFFSLNAFVTELAGLDDSAAYAGWAPVFFNLLDLGALYLIFRASSYDDRMIWLGLWFFYLANWVGQDYFSPQAMNYFLHLVLLGSVLRWFRPVGLPSKQELRRWILIDWATEKVYSILNRVHISEPQIGEQGSQPRAGLILVALLLLATIASSHQLTPFMTLMGLMALVVCQRCSARSLPLLAFVLAFTWLIYGATIFMQGELSSLVESFAQVQDALDSGFINLGSASFAQQLIATMGRGLTVSIWGLALLGAIRRLRKGFWDLSMMLLAATPMLMLAGNSYGGEILFRIYFFTLPFMAFLAAGFFFPSQRSGRSWFTTFATIVVSLAMLIGLGFAYYGKDQQYYFTPNEVAATSYLESIAPPGSLIVEGTSNYPLRYRNHTLRTQHVAFVREPHEALVKILADPVTVFVRWMSNKEYPASYLIITRSMKAEVDMLGTMPARSLDAIEAALLKSSYFRVLYENPDAKIFVLADGVQDQASNRDNGSTEP
jgi:hypothetical protein